ncbi:F0F1 ATP synthase subunit beta [bacterium]|nr:MAG: F0F1 ATP synthase subunit beta [bacterium]
MDRDKNQKAGYVIAVQGPVVDVRFHSTEDIPGMYENINTSSADGKRIVLEVAEYLPGNIARCIAVNSTFNLQRGSAVCPTGEPIKVPSGESVYGRIINAWGEPIDQKGEINSSESFPIRKPKSNISIQAQECLGTRFEQLETGIKIIDLLSPMVKGTRTGILGGAALGKSILTLEIIHNIVKKYSGSCVFVGAGERIREGNELYHELSRRGILSKTILIFGQMNESPGARFEVAKSGVTLAESIQRKNQDVLLFVDNIFRFLQAGAEISSLLGRIPSETGYQPTLVSEASEFHERIRPSSSGGGSITSVEAVYIPADDLTDPAVVTIFSFLDSVMVLSRQRVQLGLYPAIDPLMSSSANLDADIVGRRHFDTAAEVLRVLQRYEELRKLVIVIGVDELSGGDRIIYERARKLQNFLTQPFFVAEAYTGKKGEYVTIEQTLDGCEKIISGHFDRRPEGDFYLIGTI